ncbi:unnamed protein product, partial [Symbiodinium sp. CCMP2456]
AILMDVKPAVKNLNDTKTRVSRALGKKEPDATLQPLVEALLQAIEHFKQVAKPVRDAEQKSSAAAKPKGKAKAKGKS